MSNNEKQEATPIPTAVTTSASASAGASQVDSSIDSELFHQSAKVNTNFRKYNRFTFIFVIVIFN